MSGEELLCLGTEGAGRGGAGSRDTNPGRARPERPAHSSARVPGGAARSKPPPPAGVSAATGDPEAQRSLPFPPRSGRGRSRYSQATGPVLPSAPAPPQTNMAAAQRGTSASGAQGRGTAPVLPRYWLPAEREG